MQTNDREWKDVVGYEGTYRVSSAGDVFSLTSSRLLKPYLGLSGYYVVSLCGKGKQKLMKIQVLVATAFHGPKPWPEAVIRHLDGDPLNNKVDNLKWGTRKENGEDMIRHGRSTAGERNKNAKLTKDDIVRIRALARTLNEPDKVSQQVLAQEYGVSSAHISGIVARRWWPHV